jgi:ribosomal protein L37AE/L43A
MRDIFENAIVCEDCDRKTERGAIQKAGFQLRFWKCASCGKIWYHPADLKDYEDFNKLRRREFAVKLRMVGNSWAISIPREIINFQDAAERAVESHFASMRQMSERMNKMVRLCLEGPGKIGLFFGEQAEQNHEKEHPFHESHNEQKSNGKKKVRVINKDGQVNA